MTCFTGEDALTLESGASKPLREVRVGDRVLTSDARGALSFATVVFLPHGPNMAEAAVVAIVTAGGKSLRATPMHLLRTCDGRLAYASTLAAGACLRTVDGDDTVVSARRTFATGLYTAVTTNEFLVVNGIVASPFAVAHTVAHAYYHLHRALYARAPSILKLAVFGHAGELLARSAVVALSFFSRVSS